MKKTIAVLLSLILAAAALAACGLLTNRGADFPFVGTWANKKKSIFIKIYENGTADWISVDTDTVTVTENGAPVTKKVRTITSTSQATWSYKNGKFLYNDLIAYTPSEFMGTYALIENDRVEDGIVEYAHNEYYKVGDLDYDVLMFDDTDYSLPSALRSGAN